MAKNNSRDYVSVPIRKGLNVPHNEPTTPCEIRVITAFLVSEQRAKLFFHIITRPGATEATVELPYKEECVEENSHMR